MPIPIRDLNLGLKQQARDLIQYSFSSDFYSLNGFKESASLIDTAKDWLAYSDHIYLNGDCLTNLVELARADNLLKQITQQCAVDDEAIKIKRLKAWTLLLKKLVGDERLSLSDSQSYCRVIKALEESGYASERNLNKYNLTDGTVAQQDLSDSLVVCNLVLQHAFDYLTLRDEDSLVVGFTQIIRDKLLKLIEPEQNKKAMVQSLLTYAYRGGVFQALYRAHAANIKSGYKLNLEKDFAQTTIEFKSNAESILVKEQTPISEVISINGLSQSFTPSRNEEKEEKSRESSLGSMSLSASEAPSSASIPVDNITATHVPLNIIETTSTTNFVLVNPGQVAIMHIEAISRSCKTKNFVLNMLVDRWQAKMADMAAYAQKYISQQKHDEQMQQILFEKYPELKSEQSNKQEWRWRALFSTAQAVHGRGDQIFAYLGRNAPGYGPNQIYKSLPLYAYQGENEFTHAIKLLRRLGAGESIKLALAPYLLTSEGQAAANGCEFMKEVNVRKAYRFLKGHAVYLVFQILPDMQFSNATVITQSPPSLLQFDRDGNKTELLRGKELTDALPSLKSEYFLQLRVLKVCEFIKPFLSRLQLDEMEAVIHARGGASLVTPAEYFVYPIEKLVKPNNLLKLNETENHANGNGNGMRHA
jgi:hypothetical protein